MTAQKLADDAIATPRRRERTVAILAYHKIGEPSPDGWDSWYYVSETIFAGHLQWLSENDWTVIDLATFFRSLAEPSVLPERSALLTFDDGYRSMRDVALPILLRFGYPSVLFMPTEHVGKTNSFDSDDDPTEAICDWDDLRELDRNNVSIQSHGVSHRTFSDLSDCEQEEELRLSKSAIEAMLNRPVDVFAYPYGDSGRDPVRLRKIMESAGYRAAFLYKGGPSRVPVADPFQVTRIAVGPDTDLPTEMAID